MVFLWDFSLDGLQAWRIFGGMTLQMAIKSHRTGASSQQRKTNSSTRISGKAILGVHQQRCGCKPQFICHILGVKPPCLYNTTSQNLEHEGVNKNEKETVVAAEMVPSDERNDASWISKCTWDILRCHLPGDINDSTDWFPILLDFPIFLFSLKPTQKKWCAAFFARMARWLAVRRSFCCSFCRQRGGRGGAIHVAVLGAPAQQLGIGDVGEPSSKEMPGMATDGDDTRPGKHTKSYWKWSFTVDFPIENGDFP